MLIRDPRPDDETAWRRLWSGYIAFYDAEVREVLHVNSGEAERVDPQARGHGLGRALIDDLLILARDRGWSPIYWHTRRSNEAARRLYDNYVEADDFVRYRMILD